MKLFKLMIVMTLLVPAFAQASTGVKTTKLADCKASSGGKEVALTSGLHLTLSQPIVVANPSVACVQIEWKSTTLVSVQYTTTQVLSYGGSQVVRNNDVFLVTGQHAKLEFTDPADPSEKLTSVWKEYDGHLAMRNYTKGKNGKMGPADGYIYLPGSSADSDFDDLNEYFVEHNLPIPQD